MVSELLVGGILLVGPILGVPGVAIDSDPVDVWSSLQETIGPPKGNILPVGWVGDLVFCKVFSCIPPVVMECALRSCS